MSMTLSRLSMRTRLVIGMLALMVIGLVAATGSGIVLLRSYLTDRVDSQVTALAPEAPPGLVTDSSALCRNPRDPRGLRSDYVLLVVENNGDVLCSLGPNLGDAGPDFNNFTITNSRNLTTVRSLDGSSNWRVSTSAADYLGRTTVVAVSLADTEATVAKLVNVSLAVNLAVLLLTGLAAWWIAKLGLLPLRKIEDTAAQIAAGDLSRRVPAGSPNTEIGRLSSSLNGMLGQIEQAFTDRAQSEAKLRRFIQDASHELRTPVASIRGHAEMWRTGVTQDLDQVMGRIESESIRMGNLVDDMLLLARLDQSRPLEQEPVDLLMIATDVVVDARALQPERSVELTAETGNEPPVVVGDEPRLRQVLSNLMMNALRHTPESAAVTMTVKTSADSVTITVHDEGPGIPADVVSKIFDRFYRAHAGRSRDAGGAGLGLAIVRSTTEAHGGTVQCHSTLGKGTTFTVQLPLASGDDRSA